MDREAGGCFFRQAWISGVNKHYPGTPKPGYVAPWEAISEWEKESVMEVYEQVRGVIVAGMRQGQATRLNREQGGRVIRLGWIGQIYRHIADPKLSYVCRWEEMLAYMDIFEAMQAQISAV